MAYSETEKALAVEIVRRNSGVLDALTLASIRSAIGRVSAPTVRSWLKSSLGKKVNLPEKILGDQADGDEPPVPSPEKSRKQRAPVKVWDKAFLGELRLSGIVSAACLIADVDQSTVYHRRSADPIFAAAWNQAIEESADWLEKEARRRAEEGTLKPVYYKGELCGWEREYSDTLMALLLKANRPDKFGDKLTVRLDPRQAAILARHNLSAGEAMEMLIQELAGADASTE